MKGNGREFKMNLSDIMAEEQANRLAEAKAEIAAEKAAWEAMTPEQQADIIKEREAKFERLEQASNEEAEVCENCGNPDCDFDCDGEYDG